MLGTPPKRRPESQYGRRELLNLIPQFNLKYKETSLALNLTSIQNKQKINYNNLQMNRKPTS